MQLLVNTLATFLDKSNVVVSGVTALTILYTRSAGIAYFAAGALVCSRVAKFLKRFVRQPRPFNPRPRRQKVSYGMPSTHSAVVAHCIVYTLLAARRLPLHPSLPEQARTFGPLIIVPWSAAIAISRIWLGHHTWQQVVAGCLLGVAFAFFWFSNWTNGLNEYGTYFEQKYLLQWI
ncbi:PAP2-domain-containing protein [Trametopsis cervina]|nr:PAP2-domain-containing protein [Trametopsis cervina]